MHTEEEKYHEFMSSASQYEDSIHLDDLWKGDSNIQQIKSAKNTYKITPKTLHLHNVLTLFRAALDGFLTLLTDWTLPITHPLNWLYLIFVYPIVLFSFFIFELSVIILQAVRLDVLIKFVDEKWRFYVTPVELFDSEFYGDELNRVIAEDGVDALDQPYHQDGEVIETHSNFNIDIAQLLLYMSDLVYTRESDQALNAKLKVHLIKKSPERHDGLINEIVGLLRTSDETIRNQAKKWHLNFSTVTELNSLGDSFAGLFFSEKHNFIVVTFKGPSPDDFDKWFADLVLQHEDGRSDILGDVHKGYRSLLYPEHDHSGPHTSPHTSPYTSIIKGINHAAKKIHDYHVNKRGNKHINVWITGHSLGGAMATWFYGKCRKSPSDLGEHCVLRDAYVFGAPRVGDSDFISTYKASLSNHDDVKNTLWRVVDDNDLLAHLPPGYHYPKNAGKYNVLTNYSIGESIRFYQDKSKKPKLLKNSIDKPEHNPVIKSSRPIDGSKYDIPLHEHDKYLPSFIRNHMTSRYAIALAFARNHLHEKEGGSGTKRYNGEIVLEREK